MHTPQTHYLHLFLIEFSRARSRTYSVMATIRVDGELNRIASEVLADSGRFLVVEIQALIAPQAR